MSASKFIGVALAAVGLIAIVAGLYIFVTQPLQPGDAGGALTKSILCGIGGFFMVCIGGSVAEEAERKEKKNGCDKSPPASK